VNSDSITLHIVSKEPGAYLAEVTLYVDGHKKRFLLDTGAATSSIETDKITANYPSLGRTESRGVSGKAIICDYVQPEKITLGRQEFTNARLKRCDRNILGIDLLGQFIFQIDFARENLNFVPELPSYTEVFNTKRLSPGHFTIPMELGEKKIVDVLFDTGADTTVIDSKFIEKHPELFKLVRSEDGFDAHGNKIPSKIYQANSLKVGALEMSSVEMASFDFGEFMRDKMEGAPVILGNNVITKGMWSFDLKAGKWTVEGY